MHVKMQTLIEFEEKKSDTILNFISYFFSLPLDSEMFSLTHAFFEKNRLFQINVLGSSSLWTCGILTTLFLFFPLRLLAVRVEGSNGMVLNYSQTW
jgi:hypothetical protein